MRTTTSLMNANHATKTWWPSSRSTPCSSSCWAGCWRTPRTPTTPTSTPSSRMRCGVRWAAVHGWSWCGRWRGAARGRSAGRWCWCARRVKGVVGGGVVVGDDAPSEDKIVSGQNCIRTKLYQDEIVSGQNCIRTKLYQDKIV